MALSKKHKVILWSFLLVFVLVVFFVLHTPYMRVRSIARTFNRWTSPSVGRGGLLKWVLANELAIPRLERIVAKDCRAIEVYPDGRVDSCTGRRYVNSMTGKWFVWNTNRIILSGPVIEPNDNGYIARTTEFLNDHSEIELIEVELFIKKYDGKYLISRIKNTRKTPTEEQLSKFQDMIKARWYDRDEGFGGRYNEPYTFSGMGFSPDGDKITFSLFTLKTADIYIVNVNGSDLKKLTNTKYWEVAPQFTPDGQSIMFICDKENYAGEIYLIDLDGSNYRRLAPDYFGVSEACYSPNGKYVAFTSQQGTACEVYIMDADGGNIRKLTSDGNQCSSLKFSPDGKKLFFVQSWCSYDKKPEPHEDIFSINVDGTGLKQLTYVVGGAGNEMVLDVTDKYVFFVHVVPEDISIDINKRPNNHEVWQMAHDGNRQRRIIGGEITRHPYKDARAISDGRAIIFVDSEPADPFAYDLRIKSLNDAKKTTQLTTNCSCRDSMITVSPDENYVAYMLLSETAITGMKETRGIRVLSADGKESWIIADKGRR
ncbi:MAG: DPP IV N-terminal domain-containing protein [Phycisphaerae bacterium]|nr:DPP IV N-terminal domain-containing protein [Phycisphaerae bacterium]MDD5381367.1 DPP IV N-terminal domain-containing protein [Phycisphaerae bacterium]